MRNTRRTEGWSNSEGDLVNVNATFSAALKRLSPEQKAGSVTLNLINKHSGTVAIFQMFNLAAALVTSNTGAGWLQSAFQVIKVTR